jgi:soluble lytic murein transglycosylase-like protein
MIHRMKISLFLIVLTVLFAASIATPEVLVKMNSNGKKVFYNIPPKKIQSNYQFKQANTAALRFSKRAGEYTPLIEKACSKYNVDPELVKAVIQVESAYNSQAKSHAGAIGLMQLMPGTAQRFGVKQIYDPHENVHGGVQYLSFLLTLFNNDLPLAVAAYNAGEGAVQRFKGIPRYTETQNYVRKVLTLYGKEGYAASAVSKPAPPKTIYKYMDSKGILNFTTERPTAMASTATVSR